MEARRQRSQAAGGLVQHLWEFAGPDPRAVGTPLPGFVGQDLLCVLES